MLLNLGCGDRYVPGWHNVDFGSPHRKDDTVDLTKPLPWLPSSALHAYLGHVLEHLTLRDALTLLKRLRQVIKPGGSIMVVGPDVEVAQRMADEGTLDVTLDSLKYGADRWAGDQHHWECASDILVDMLKQAGWDNVEDVGIDGVIPFWPVADRGPRWQCAVYAERVK